MTALQIGALIFLSYAIAALNTRAIAKDNYLGAAASGAIFIVANFFLIRYVAEAKTLAEFAGYFVGGVSGDLAGIWIGKRLERRAS